ncbi:DJ-1/PfpI family protein [Parapusillimonas sp. JC17]|uniref:DJ-1/PfpI family protein n=1 Tax=Parapusillimonas sp. JC17 TaxID=3445768 RepID=UPI003FA0D6EA
MNLRRILWVVLGIVISLSALGTAWLMSLPATPGIAAAASIPETETAAMLAALQPPKRSRPVIAIIAINDATETTDFLMPYGILKRADAADVMALATRPGLVSLYPALQAEPDATIAQFDERYPDGADYVIVPAMSRDDDPEALQWIKQQADKGAIIVSVCAGAKVAAAAGLLDGRSATTHWYYVDELLEEHPEIRYVENRRMVVDRAVASTTGITASMPMMLTLIEAFAGKEKAAAIAAGLGVANWDARHDSAAFKFTRAFAATAIANRLAFWRAEDLGIPLRPGVDEVSLALVADAWSRTYRSSVVTYANGAQPVETRHGLRIIPDKTSADWPANRKLTRIEGLKPAEALDHALAGIALRYGKDTAHFVAMQLEYAPF